MINTKRVLSAFLSVAMLVGVACMPCSAGKNRHRVNVDGNGEPVFQRKLPKAERSDQSRLQSGFHLEESDPGEEILSDEPEDYDSSLDEYYESMPLDSLCIGDFMCKEYGHTVFRSAKEKEIVYTWYNFLCADDVLEYKSGDSIITRYELAKLYEAVRNRLDLPIDEAVSMIMFLRDIARANGYKLLDKDNT